MHDPQSEGDAKGSVSTFEPAGCRAGRQVQGEPDVVQITSERRRDAMVSFSLHASGRTRRCRPARPFPSAGPDRQQLLLRPQVQRGTGDLRDRPLFLRRMHYFSVQCYTFWFCSRAGGWREHGTGDARPSGGCPAPPERPPARGRSACPFRCQKAERRAFPGWKKRGRACGRAAGRSLPAACRGAPSGIRKVADPDGETNVVRAHRSPQTESTCSGSYLRTISRVLPRPVRTGRSMIPAAASCFRRVW